MADKKTLDYHVTKEGFVWTQDPEGQPWRLTESDAIAAFKSGKGWAPLEKEITTKLERREVAREKYSGIEYAPVAAAAAAGSTATLGLTDHLARSLGVEAETLDALYDTHPVAEFAGSAASFLIPGTSAVKGAKAARNLAKASQSVAKDYAKKGISRQGSGLVMTRVKTAGSTAARSSFTQKPVDSFAELMKRAAADGGRSAITGAGEGAYFAAGMASRDLATERVDTEDAAAYILKNAAAGAAIGGSLNFIGAGVTSGLRSGMDKLRHTHPVVNKLHSARTHLESMTERVKKTKDRASRKAAMGILHDAKKLANEAAQRGEVDRLSFFYRNVPKPSLTERMKQKARDTGAKVKDGVSEGVDLVGKHIKKTAEKATSKVDGMTGGAASRRVDDILTAKRGMAGVRELPPIGPFEIPAAQAVPVRSSMDLLERMNAIENKALRDMTHEAVEQTFKVAQAKHGAVISFYEPMAKKLSAMAIGGAIGHVFFAQSLGPLGMMFFGAIAPGLVTKAGKTLLGATMGRTATKHFGKKADQMFKTGFNEMAKVLEKVISPALKMSRQKGWASGTSAQMELVELGVLDRAKIKVDVVGHGAAKGIESTTRGTVGALTVAAHNVIQPNELESLRDELETIQPKTLHSILVQAGVDENIANELVEHTTRNAEFLQSKLPNPNRQPARADLLKFSRYMAAVEQPSSIMERIADLKMTREDKEVMQKLYPMELAMIQQVIREEIEEKRGFSSVQRAQHSLILGNQKSVSGASIQNRFAKAKEQKQKQKPSGSVKALAEANMTNIQKVQSRS